MAKFKAINKENYQALDALMSMADKFLCHYSDDVVYPANNKAEQQAVETLQSYGLLTATDNGYLLERRRMLKAVMLNEDKRKEKKLRVFRAPGYKSYGIDIMIDGVRYTPRFSDNEQKALTEAKAWYTAKLDELANPDKSAAWNKFKQYFLSEYMPLHKYSKKSIQTYSYHFLALEKYFNPKRLSDITFEKLLTYRKHLKQIADEKESDYHGANKRINVVRNIFGVAASEGFMQSIGVEQLTNWPINNKAKTDAFSEEELNLFYKYSDDYWRLGLLHIIDGSLRPDEGMNTLVANVDFDRHIGYLCALEADPNRGIVEFMPKTKFGKPADRHYLFSGRAVEAYKNFPLSGNIYVFPSPDGKRWKDTGALNKAFKAQLEAVNEKARKDNPGHVDIVGTIKMLRKTAATHIYGNSGSEEQSQKALGHSKASTTKTHYIDQKSKAVIEQKIKAVLASEEHIARIDVNVKKKTE